MPITYIFRTEYGGYIDFAFDDRRINMNITKVFRDMTGCITVLDPIRDFFVDLDALLARLDCLPIEAP